MTREQESFGAFIRGLFHNWKGKIWFFLNMFFTIMYLIWRIFFTIPFGYGMVSIVAVIGFFGGLSYILRVSARGGGGGVGGGASV